MIRVNLTPREILDKELERQRLAQVSVAGAALGVLFLVVSALHYYKNVSLQRDLDKDNAEYTRLQAIVKQVEAREAEAKDVKSHLDIIKGLLEARPFYPRFMTELVKALGDGVWLTTLSASGAPPKQLSVKLGCRAVSSEAATNWLRSLDRSPVFQSPTMGAMTVETDGTVAFSMQLSYMPAASAAPGGR